MKKTFLLLITIALISCGKQTETKETPVQEVKYASYGEEITDKKVESAQAVSELIANKDSLQVKLRGEIDKTCKMKGCWMTVKTGDSSTMRVTFKDYGFFVPKEGVSGKTAVFDGMLTKSVTSVETLRHFAQDEGKSAAEIEAITEPKEEYAFVANGVLIEED